MHPSSHIAPQTISLSTSSYWNLLITLFILTNACLDKSACGIGELSDLKGFSFWKEKHAP